MSKYKIEALENVRIVRLNIRLSPGQTHIFESDNESIINEAERLANIGSIRLRELEEIEHTTYEEPEEQESEEEDKESVEEDIDDDKYYCEKCGRNHYYDSDIGQRHLSEDEGKVEKTFNLDDENEEN